MDPFSGIFNAISASLSARSFAAMTAAMQKHHYEQLRAEGMSDRDALELTARTTESLGNTLAQIVNAVSRNGKTLAEGIRVVVETAEKYGEDR